MKGSFKNVVKLCKTTQLGQEIKMGLQNLEIGFDFSHSLMTDLLNFVNNCYAVPNKKLEVKYCCRC